MLKTPFQLSILQPDSSVAAFDKPIIKEFDFCPQKDDVIIFSGITYVVVRRVIMLDDQKSIPLLFIKKT